jgi:hypothetical protein
MITLQLIPDQFSTSIYTFGSPPPGAPATQVLTTIYQDQTTSPNLQAGETAAAAIRSPVGPDAANTNFPQAMINLAQASPIAGNGSTMSSPKRALIIVTDALADYGSRVIPSTEGPINPANCDAMKALGYSVYVLYTTYITNPTPPTSINAVLLNNGALQPLFAPPATPGIACASSPSNYIEASDPADINTAMTQLLKAALGNGGRFTK